MSKTLEKYLEEDSVSLLLSIPNSINELIVEYQTNEKNRYNKKTTKQHLVISMMMMGIDSFVEESAVMKAEYERYNS